MGYREQNESAKSVLKLEIRPRSILIALILLIAAGFFAFAKYQDMQRRACIRQIMTGEIRGNKRTGIFHVPTCPQYEAIAPGNVRRFATVEEAEAANYRESANCLDAALTRRINETETEDTDVAPEGPR